MTRAIRIVLAGASLVMIAASAHAQIVNGNFEMGSLGWGAGGPVTWSFSFPPTGGNPDGHAQIDSPSTASAGQLCITQQFFCGSQPGENTGCAIHVQYLLQNVQAGANSGRVRILLDGVEKYVSPGPSDGWVDVAFSVPCGSHQIALCLQVDAGDNAWQARFDNASGLCDVVVSTRPKTWGKLKILYW